jgi:DNA repair exonuclease SbcCD nuclease subunit
MWAVHTGAIMKFICTADWHIRLENPKYRKDKYFETQLRKLEWLVAKANEEEAMLLIAGDLFDSPKAGYTVSNAVGTILKKLNIPAVACFGNHDTTFHSQNLSNTPYGNLLVHNVIREGLILSDVEIHPVGWESEAPKPTKGKLNILLGHVSVFEKEVPFWCSDGIAAKQVEKIYPGFHYYVFGDIHIPFVTNKIINPGSLTRATAGQIDFEPRIYLLDTDKDTIESILIPMESSSTVFNLEQRELDALKDVKSLNTFIDTIKYSGDKPKFRNVLDEVVKQASVSKEVIEIINQVMEEA